MCDLRYTKCWFDTLVYGKMITTVKLANTSIISHNYYFFVVEMVNIYYLSIFQVNNIVSVIIFMYMRSTGFIYLMTRNLYPLTDIFPFPPYPSLW